MEKINVIYEDNHLLVVEKPINVPVCLDDSGDKDLLSMLKSYLKDKYNKLGNVYLGLVHRLDRPVGGVMVFAKTSKCASRLSEQIRNGCFLKKYYAVVYGDIEATGVYEDKLLKDSKTNTVVVSPLGKKAVLRYDKISHKDDYSLVDISLVTGRSHQIRVQFSSRNYPLYGDQRYNKKAVVGEQIALFAYSLGFNHPVTGEKLTFELSIPNRFPFNKF